MAASDKRSIKNFIIDPIMQFRFSFYMFGIIFLFTLTVGIYAYISLSEFLEVMIELSEVSDEAKIFAMEEISGFGIGLVIIMFIFFVLGGAFIIVQTHRIVGASYHICKFIKETLLEGEYGHPLNLRANDYLKEIALVVTKLSMRLKELEGSSGTKSEEPKQES